MQIRVALGWIPLFSWSECKFNQTLHILCKLFTKVPPLCVPTHYANVWKITRELLHSGDIKCAASTGIAWEKIDSCRDEDDENMTMNYGRRWKFEFLWMPETEAEVNVREENSNLFSRTPWVNDTGVRRWSGRHWGGISNAQEANICEWIMWLARTMMMMITKTTSTLLVKGKCEKKSS